MATVTLPFPTDLIQLLTPSSARHSQEKLVVTVCTYKQVHLNWSTELWPMYFFV